MTQRSSKKHVLPVPAAFLMLISMAAVALSQRDSNFILFDSVGTPNYEVFANRLDILAVRVNELPGSKGFVVIHEGSDQVQNAFSRKTLHGYINFRRFDAEKLVILIAAESTEEHFDFWISKDGTKPDLAYKNPDYLLEPNAGPVKFSDSQIEILKINGSESWAPNGCDAGCMRELDFSVLREFLSANPGRNAFVILGGKSQKKIKRLKGVLTQDATKNFGIAPNRLIILWASRQQTSESNYVNATVYLATDISKLPKSSSGRYFNIK
jgi:hypothetical protein